MNLRAKTLLIAVVTFTIVFAAVSIALDRVVTRAFLRLEEEEVRRKVQEVHPVIANEIADLESLVADWARRDDTYAFVSDKNQNYIKSNLGDDNLISNRLNLVLYLDTSGGKIFAKAYSAIARKEIPLPAGLELHLSPGSPLLKPATGGGISGIVLFPEFPVFVAGHSILPGSGTGPARGTLILGRFLDDLEIAHLTGITHVSLSISPTPKGAGLAPDVETAVVALKKKPGIFVKPLNTYTAAGYYLFNDVYGEPAFALKVTMPRTIYAQGTSTVSFFRMTVIIIGLLSVVLVLASSEQMVISRILRLSDSVSRVGTTMGPATSVLIPGKDEVSRLAGSIDNMLGRLEIAGSQLRLRAELLDSANDFIFLRDLTGKFLYVNEMGSKLYGYSREELINLSMSDLVAPHLLYNYDNRVREILEKGEARFETQHRRKDGTLVDVDVSSRVIKTEDGTFFLSTIRDITERKKAEEELHLRAELLDAATDSIILREFVGEGAGKSVYVNRAAYESRGYTREEFMSMRIQDYNTPESARLVEEHLRDLATKGTGTYEAVQRRKDGTVFIVEVHAEVVTLGGKKYILSVSRDITERKQAEQKLQELYENEKKLSQRLEEEIRNRAEYTRALVHELKTPLTPVMASSELLLEELKEEPFRSLALNVSRGAENLNRRINELLDLARGEIGALKINPMPMDPNRLLEEIAESSRPIAGSTRQTFELEIPTRLPDIIADEDRLRQILLNLVGNALKYTPSGGRITVRAEAKDANLVFEIKDTGPGISDDEKGLLFQPYYRLERDRERVGGIGLGLFLSKTLVELHGGKIWIESKPGEGSTFAFSIPMGNPKEWIDSWQGR